MTNAQKLKTAIDSASAIDTIENISGVAMIHLRTIPESYDYLGDSIIGDYRVSVYDMKTIGRSYVLDVHGVGMFQIL
jgi:hypothetical protein